MKNILIEILSSRIFQIGGLGCLLFIAGIYFYAQWDKARFEAALPIAPPQDTQTDTQTADSTSIAQGDQSADKPPVSTVPRTYSNTRITHTHAGGHTHPHAPATPSANGTQRTQDTDKWIVMWPPDIPGLGVHPKRPRPPEIPIEVLSEIDALSSAVKRGELLRGDRALAEDHLGRELSEEQYNEMLEDIRSSDDILTQEEYDQKAAAILSDFWNVDIDDADGLIQGMETYEFAPDFLMKRIESEHAFQTLFNWWKTDTVRTVETDMLDTYAERALSVNPNNINARFRVAETIEDYYAILDMDPNYYFAMDAIGAMRYYDAPEEVIPLLQKSRDLGSKAANMQLGWAYERLGDYKTAWTHYYKSLTIQPDGQVPLMHMGAILRGEPRIEPIQRKAQTLPPARGAFDSQSDIYVDMATDRQLSPDTADWQLTPQEADPAEAASNVKAEAAKKAAQEFQKLQHQSQQEFEEFLDWLEHDINDAPNAQDFLSQQMKAFLRPERGTNAAHFAPERIIRAQETLERYGPEEGLKRLEQDDPEIAEHIRRNPPLSRDKKDE